MNKNVVFAVVLGLLLLVSAVQAVQLSTLKAKVDAGALKVSSAKSTTAVSAGTSGTGGGVDNLPTMVGGC